MNNGGANKLDSMLSYVSGRDGSRGPNLFDKEVGSWLMMATELVPQTPPLNSSVATNGVQQEEDTLPFPSNNEFDPLGFNSNSPFFNSALFPPSPFGVSRNTGRKDSLDLITLPSPLVNHPVKTETLTEHVTPTSNSSLFFDTSAPGAVDIFSNLPSLDSIPTIKTEPDQSVQSTPLEDDYENEASIKRQRRLAKNREIAKNCRRRKKERKAAIQEEILQLREQNSKLRQQVENMHSQVFQCKQSEEEHKAFLQRLKDCIARNDEESILREIHEYYKLWSEYGKERSAACQIYLEQLKMLLLPTQMTKMCLWSMGQEDEFYDEKLNKMKYGGGIWNILSSVMNLSQEQKHRIVSSRGGLLRQQENISAVLDIVDTIQNKMKVNMESMHEQMQGILSVLSPMQQAKFLVWVEGGMNGRGLITTLRRVLEMQKHQDSVVDDSQSLSQSLSELDSST